MPDLQKAAGLGGGGIGGIGNIKFQPRDEIPHPDTLHGKVESLDDLIAQAQSMANRLSVIADRIVGPQPEGLTAGACLGSADVGGGPLMYRLQQKRDRLADILTTARHDIDRIENAI